MRHLAFVLLLSLSGFVACDQKPQTPAPTGQTAAEPAPSVEAPADVALKYYRLLAEAKHEEAFALVNPDDRAARPIEEFVAAAADPVQAAITKQRTFAVKDTKVTGDTAQVMIDATGPDVAKIQGLIMQAKAQESPELPSQQTLREAMATWVAKPDAPKLVTHQQVFLKLVDGVWMLDFDWDGEHPLRAVPIQVKPEQPDMGGAHD